MVLLSKDKEGSKQHVHIYHEDANMYVANDLGAYLCSGVQLLTTKASENSGGTAEMT